MLFYINGQKVTGLAAEAHFIHWCLSIENEAKLVPHCALDASAEFQRGAYQNIPPSLDLIAQSGITLKLGDFINGSHKRNAAMMQRDASWYGDSALYYADLLATPGNRSVDLGHAAKYQQLAATHYQRARYFLGLDTWPAPAQ